MSIRRRLYVSAAAGLVALTAGTVTWLRISGHDGGPAAAGVPTTTATVTLGTVAERQNLQGTLTNAGQITAVNNEPGGIYTALPATGSVLRQGDIAYQVDATPVTLMYGPVPMWRSFALGMTAGADVRELETDLVALGFDPGHDITIDGDFTWATAAAVERWQHARGLAETGSIPLGQILFVRSPVRVGTVAVSAGMAALPGSTVFSGTTLTPSVVVDLDPHAQLHVSTGQAVVVTLPDSTDTTGHITQVQPATSGSSTTGTPAGGAGTVQSQAAIPVIISLDHPRQAGAADASPVQVQFTTAEHHHVLTVPTTALLAEPGGHYAVQVAGQTGARLVRVTAGLFDDTTGMAEVASLQLRPGMRVEVPAS